MSEHDDMPPLEDESPSSPRTMRRSGAHGDTQEHPEVDCVDMESDENDTDDDDDDDDDDGEWEEEEEEMENEVTKCLFCSTYSPSVAGILLHMEYVHQFEIPPIIYKFHLDDIGYIKLINYIRQENPTVEELNNLDNEKECVWDNDSYMNPVIRTDPLLMYGIDEYPDKEVWQKRASNIDISNLQSTCTELQGIIAKQREMMQLMLSTVKIDNREDEKQIRTVGDIRPEEDAGYFSSYAHFDIHHEMLSDKVRTESYRDAILNNSSLLKDKKVLDLGCGTAILSMFSAKAGATVTGVDMSEVIYQAMDIVKENRLDKSITLVRGRLEDMEFDKKFDFIVSEWMGYFLLFEGMLDSVLYAREHHLAEGGMLLPNRCTMFLVGMEDLDTFNKMITFWDDVYGFKMSCMRRDVIKEATTNVVKQEHIITSADQIADLDLMTICPNDTEFTSKFSLTAERDGQLTGFVGYFDTFFELPSPVMFSTGPQSTPTHWKQTIFYLPSPRAVIKGEVLQGTLSVRRKRREVRSLDVGISFDDRHYKYMVE